MGLQELNENLYKRDGVQRDRAPHQPFDATHQTLDTEKAQQSFVKSTAWDVQEESVFVTYRDSIRKGVIILGVLVFAVLTYFTVVQIKNSAFTSDKVTLTVDGPKDVSGSESSRFVFTYANENRADLTDVDLILNYPENFRPDPLENMSINGSSSTVHILKIAGHSHGKIELRGKFSGSKGTLAYIKGSLKYKPENVGSYFQSDSQLGVTIQSPSMRLAIDAPIEVATGGVVEYRLDYTNMSDVTFERLRVKLEYPSGFFLQDASPKSSEGDSIWYIGSLAPGAKGSIWLKGTVEGAKDEAKVLRAHIGMLQGDGELLSYSDNESLTKIVTSPLSIKQTVNGLDTLNVSPGSILKYDVRFKNDSSVGMRDAIINLELNGVALDYANLQLQGGSFDDKRKVITWKASDVRELANLAPGQGGSVRFTIPVLGKLPITTEADKNFVITSIAKIDSPDVPTRSGVNKIIGSNTVRMKLNSSVGLQVVSAQQDASIPNTGVEPPVVGQETTYTIHWILSNSLNDVDQVSVSAFLPTGVRYTGKMLPEGENITFNERTNQIVWNVGSISNGTGIVKPLKEVMFQVGVTPQINQLGQQIALLDETSLVAHDTFTNESIQTKQQSIRISVSQ